MAFAKNSVNYNLVSFYTQNKAKRHCPVQPEQQHSLSKSASKIKEEI